MPFADMGGALDIGRNNAYMITQYYREQFTFVTIADKKRVTRESLECWYAMQHKYCKAPETVDTPPQAILAEKAQNAPLTQRKTL